MIRGYFFYKKEVQNRRKAPGSPEDEGGACRAGGRVRQAWSGPHLHDPGGAGSKVNRIGARCGDRKKWNFCGHCSLTAMGVTLTDTGGDFQQRVRRHPVGGWRVAHYELQPGGGANSPCACGRCNRTKMCGIWPCGSPDRRRPGYTIASRWLWAVLSSTLGGRSRGQSRKSKQVPQNLKIFASACVHLNVFRCSSGCSGERLQKTCRKLAGRPESK